MLRNTSFGLFSWRCREESWVSIGVVAFAYSSRWIKDSLCWFIHHTVQKNFFIFTFFLNAPSQFLNVCRCSCSLPRWRNSHMAAQCAAFFFFIYFLFFTSGWSELSGRYFDSTSAPVHSLCDVILPPDDTGSNLITSQLLSEQRGEVRPHRWCIHFF